MVYSVTEWTFVQLVFSECDYLGRKADYVMLDSAQTTTRRTVPVSSLGKFEKRRLNGGRNTVAMIVRLPELGKASRRKHSVVSDRGLVGRLTTHKLISEEKVAFVK